MYAATHYPSIARSLAFRWGGRICGIALFAVWTAFVAFEATRPTVVTWPVGLYMQGAALAMVFLGYAVGWKQELAGAVLIGVGGLAYFVITVVDTMMLPGLAIAWFLVPGVLYLFARHYERVEHAAATT
jgi:hypothetical protein